MRLGLRTLDAVEVLDGLKEGDTVLRGHASLQDGQRVRARTVPWMTSSSAPTRRPKAIRAGAQACVDRRHGPLSLPPCGSGPALSFAWRCAFARRAHADRALIVGVAAGVAVIAYISALINGLQANTLAKTLGAPGARHAARPDDLVTPAAPALPDAPR